MYRLFNARFKQMFWVYYSVVLEIACSNKVKPLQTDAIRYKELMYDVWLANSL